jgi:hypothetical protein
LQFGIGFTCGYYAHQPATVVVRATPRPAPQRIRCKVDHLAILPDTHYIEAFCE